MSSRALAQRYHGNGGPSLGTGRNDPASNPSLLSSLFGQDAVTGGDYSEDPLGGEDTFNPYKGSGGIFGGQSRRLATLLNAQRNSQQEGYKADKDYAKLAGQIEQDRMKSEEALKEKYATNETVQKLSLTHDVHPDEILSGALRDSMTAGANITQMRRNNAIARPEAQPAFNTGADYAASGINPNTPRTAPPGGISAFPMPAGGMGTLTGSVPTQETQLIPDPVTGMLHTLNRQANTPAGMRLPVNPLQYDQASQMPPPSGPNPNLPAGAGIAANPGLPQDNPMAGPLDGRGNIAPVPADRQNQDGIYSPQQMQEGQGFADWYNKFISLLGQGGQTGSFGGQRF